MCSNMVEVPDAVIAERVINEALEWGEFDMPDTIGLGEYGEQELDLEYSLTELKPSECDVDMYDETVVVSGEVSGSYSYQTARRTRHHPAEYTTEYVPVFISMELDLTEMDSPKVVGEIA